MKFFLNKKGFTLIELLVVTAIVGILTTIVMANFSQSRAVSRDAKRVSDLNQLKLTLEMIYDKCSVYPPNLDSISTVINTGVCRRWNGTSYVDYTLGDFISVLPTDNGTPYDYGVYAINITDPITNYVLRTNLETNSSALIDAPSATLSSLTIIRVGTAIPINIPTIYCKISPASTSYCITPF